MKPQRTWARPGRGPLVLLAGLTAGVLAAAGLQAWTAPPAPTRIAPYALDADLTRDAGALEREIAFLQRRIAARPDGFLDRNALAGAYVARARTTGEPGWYLMAEREARRSLELMPTLNHDAELALARVALARHAFPEALRRAQQVSRAEPGHEGALSCLVTIHLALGDAAAAAKAAEALVARRPGLESYTQLALVAAARGDDERAVVSFQRAIAAEQAGEAAASAQARAWLARLYLRRGLLAPAADLLREARRIAPGHPVALALQGELEARAGDHAAAAGHFAQAYGRSRAPIMLLREAEAREARGEAAEASRLQDEAERAIRQDLAAGEFGHRRDLARLLLTRGRPADDREALALMRAEAQTRQDPETLDVLAWALGRAGRWPEAREVVRRAIRGGAHDAALHARAAWVEQHAGRAAAAAEYLRAAASVDPGFAANPAVRTLVAEGLVLPADRGGAR